MYNRMFNKTVFIRTYPGCRSIQMVPNIPLGSSSSSKSKEVLDSADQPVSDFDTSLLTPQLSRFIASKIKSYQTNDQVQVILLASKDVDHFCYGIDKGLYVDGKTAQLADAVAAVHELSATIDNLSNNAKKPIISILGGDANGSGVAPFLGATYRLGTASTQLCIDELLHGHLPVGGLAHRFINCGRGRGSTEMLRYAAITARPLYADDLYMYGAITHVVGDRPDDTLGDILWRTIPEIEYGSVQKDMVAVDHLPQLLEAMHIGTPQTFMWGDDVSDFAGWDHLLLAKPDQLEDGDALMSLTGESALESIEDIEKHVRQCFRHESKEEIVAALRGKKGRWAADALAKIEAIDPSLLADWLLLTRSSQDLTLQEALSLEKELLKQ